MGVTAREITTEPEPIESNQVREPATMPATLDVPVGREGAEDSTAHCTSEVPPPLSPDSPAAHPQPTICAVGSPRVCQSPSSWLEDPLSPPSASESWTLSLRPIGSTPALSSLVSTVACQSTSSTGLHRPSGSALVGHCPAIASGCASSLRPIKSVGLLPPAPPQSSVAPAPLRTSRSLPPPRSPEPWAPPWPSRSSVSPKIIGSLSLPQAPPPPALPSVGPLELSALPPPWLLPPSAPPWATIMAVVWVLPGSSCSESLLSPPWLLLPSDSPWILLSSPWLLPPSSPPWTLFVVLLPRVRPPPEPPPTLTFCYLPTSTPLFLFLLFLRHVVWGPRALYTLCSGSCSVSGFVGKEKMKKAETGKTAMK
ncbi:Chromatin-remodeling ATPase INO80 [Labeo rohita]|uniref:Chromatin-remodeling ATPase INO80 n=1 Tax=Labeo rohita TaxID=84645 RepID=A0ABQ8LL09_LABRO|nr:Chromatin-remodeling ATPase INO80 [Labeo rohita]